jgi:hypothetical protein
VCVCVCVCVCVHMCVGGWMEITFVLSGWKQIVKVWGFHLDPTWLKKYNR